MDYKNFGLEDFLQDEYFVRWVNRPDEETKKFWENILQHYPEKRATIIKARDVIAMLHYKNEFKLESGERDTLKVRINKSFQAQSRAIRFFPMAYRIAASILILIVACFCFWYAMHSKNAQPIASESMSEWQVKEVGKGKKVSYVLADGTNIKMNSNSKCSFPSKYQKGKVREFRLLQGEAFFDVTEDSTSPFIVYTGETTTRVLGTSFNIKLDTTQQEVEIALVTGKVSVDHDEDKLQLTPGEKLDIGSDNIVKSSFDALLVTGWKDGVLIIDEMSFHDMIKQLEQWYGVDFHVATSVDTSGIYTGIYRNQTLENVLNGMGFTSELDYEIKEDNIFFY